jgi:MoxR-like ATPase
MGGGARRGYTDTNRLNAAYLDRFGARVRFEYLPERDEVKIIASRTGCTRELATLLIKAATLTRALADTEQLTAGIGLRRLLAWARLLSRGHSVADAFECAVINAAPEQDHETLRQQCALAVDAANVQAALHPGAGVVAIVDDPSLTNPSVAGRNAAQEFSLSPGTH